MHSRNYSLIREMLMEFTFYAIAFQEMQIAFLDFLILSGLQQADVRSRHGKWPQKFQWWFEGC